MSELRQFLRDENGQPCGLLVAVGNGQVGWSVTHRNDHFNKDIAVRIARGRAFNGTTAKIPFRYRPALEKMQERAKRYFRPTS